MRPEMGGMRLEGFRALDRQQSRGAIGYGGVIDGRIEILRQQRDGTENPGWAVTGNFRFNNGHSNL